jgi:hypothetical protein
MVYELSTGPWASELTRRAKMLHHIEPELLDAMKGCLHDLENVKLLSPDDLDIIDEKRLLRQKIAELEREDSDSYKRAA